MYSWQGEYVPLVRAGKQKKHGGRRRKCKECGVTWRLQKSRTRELKQAAEDWVLDRSTLRRIRDKKGNAHNTIWYRVQEYSDHIPHPIENLHLRLSEASGILVLDATHTRIKGKGHYIHIAYDTGIGVIHFAIDDSENATAYAIMLNMLAERGYKPLVVVSDAHGGILSAIADWNIPHQRCNFHLLKNLRDMLTIKRELKGNNHVLFVRMWRVITSRTIEELSQRANDLRSITFCFRKKEHYRALQLFWKTLHEATLHLSFDGLVPNTSNIIERVNGQIKARLKTMRGVKSKQSLYKLLKILFHFKHYK